MHIYARLKYCLFYVHIHGFVGVCREWDFKDVTAHATCPTCPCN